MKVIKQSNIFVGECIIGLDRVFALFYRELFFLVGQSVLTKAPG